MILSILKFISLVLAIWFSEVNIMKACFNQNISESNFIIQCVSIALFIFLQFKLF